MNKDNHNKNINISSEIVRALTHGYKVDINNDFLIPNEELKNYRLIDNELYKSLMSIIEMENNK